MSICVTLVDGVLQQATNGSCEFIVMSQPQVTELVNGQFDWSLLEFDKELYEFVLGQTLVSFVGGHVLGRILKYFGKL
ncbi:transcriptional regulator [Vibrio variabilis]|uniref:Transcriptional regulator n=3 Tax=Vibrionaceae TaxID=641 RepID=A0A0A5HZ48_PHOS4|nr:transcriptional regulator [Vibrio sinaloensis]KHA58984.1 transcriptional regulator [Vibrio variabilis]KIE18809.1 transcriptional regulator [Vibrio sinaloensis]